MGLPLNLAMTLPEIDAAAVLPERIAWMACRFSPNGQGITDLPPQIPEGSLLILNDSIPCCNHDPGLIAEMLLSAVEQFRCCGLLLDFQRSKTDAAATVVNALIQASPCPVAVTPEYAGSFTCPVFLPPGPLHIPLEKYLLPWKNREIWLEAALCQERITITKSGTSFDPIFPTQQLEGGFYDAKLYCNYHTVVSGDRITFTLFDTCETLQEKLEQVQSLGVTRMVGLYQELGEFFCAK